MKKTALIFLLMLLFPCLLSAKREHTEKWYQKWWCEAQNGQVEVVLPDGTRCDCLTDTHAVEFDFGRNWAEAIGQSAYYSLQTDTGNDERQKILDPAQHRYTALQSANRYLEHRRCIALKLSHSTN
jgi:hypothetical protein